jgi:hypothetical protein
MSEEKPTELAFSLAPVKSKPTRKYRKGSKYDPLLLAFTKGDDPLMSVEIEGRDANYIRTQLNKRIDTNDKRFRGIKVSVVNNICYLEKETPKKVAPKA